MNCLLTIKATWVGNGRIGKIYMKKFSGVIGKAHFHQGRFSILLISIILIFAVRPFLGGFVRVGILTDIFLSVIILSAIRTVSEKRSAFLCALALAFPYLLLKWCKQLLATPLIWNWAEISAALFTAYVLFFILSFIMRRQEVTYDVILKLLVK